MSYKTSCNYCTFKRIGKKAKESDRKITMEPGGIGINVYVHDTGKKPDTSEGSKDFVASFMALTNYCVC